MKKYNYSDKDDLPEDVTYSELLSNTVELFVMRAELAALTDKDSDWDEADRILALLNYDSPVWGCSEDEHGRLNDEIREHYPVAIDAGIQFLGKEHEIIDTIKMFEERLRDARRSHIAQLATLFKAENRM